MMRNRRTVIFTLVMPAVFFLLFGTGAGYPDADARRRQRRRPTSWSAWPLYGAMLATTGGGAMVAVERPPGWSRQLRLTPLSPASPTSLIKVVLAMIIGAGRRWLVDVRGRRVARRRAAGRTAGSQCGAARLGRRRWSFAAFGLFMGYLLPSENVMQILGPVLALLRLRRWPVRPGRQMRDTSRRSPSSPRCTASARSPAPPLTGDATSGRGAQRASPGRRCSRSARCGGSGADTARV